jgi:hypothetical protein
MTTVSGDEVGGGALDVGDVGDVTALVGGGVEAVVGVVVGEELSGTVGAPTLIGAPRSVPTL